MRISDWSSDVCSSDLSRGQLTQTRADAFELGRNVASTPGKVVFETELFQLIQYNPTTEEVFRKPLLIFPPWINRFYILDLSPAKSFIRWARSEEHTSELKSLMRSSYAVFCLQ